MNTPSSRRDDTQAGFPSSQVQPARLNQYTILELARLPSIAREVVVEDWLEGVYGKAIGPAGSYKVHDSDRLPKKCSIRDCSPSEGQVLASRPPTSTEKSSRCDVDTEMVERKTLPYTNMTTVGKRISRFRDINLREPYLTLH